MKRFKIKNPGFSLIEILIVVAVISLILLFIIPVLSYSRRASETMNRMDSYHDIRRIDQEIAAEIKFGSAILYPPHPGGTKAGEWFSQVIFRNSINQTQALFVNEENQLCLMNYDRIRGVNLAAPRILGSQLKEFSVRRHGSSVVEYRLTFATEQGDFSVTNRIAMMNVF